LLSVQVNADAPDREPFCKEDFMKGLCRAGTLVVVFLMASCQGDNPTIGPDPVDPDADPFAPCTDYQKCCPAEKMVCTGDPDTGIVCSCSDLWDCSKNPNKCEQPLPAPPGGGDWTCAWTEFKYTCTKKMPPPGDKGENPQTLDGGAGWYCQWVDSEFSWQCTRTPPVPSNNGVAGAGVWKCTVQGTKLVCERSGDQKEPVGGGQWTCTTDKETGKVTCKKDDDNHGLPPGGGGTWQCNKTIINGVATWVCYGTSDTPPGGGGWDCTKLDGEFNKWKCTKPEDTGDTPPGGGWYSCMKGTEFAGTTCEKVPSPPTPPGVTPKPGEKCLIGEKMWCDGAVFCGWGQVMCDPATNTWKTKTIKQADGKDVVVLDCSEDTAGGKRPNTYCACYHFYFNAACCERPDCIVPPGTTGQICPASKGGLCDYCNPRQSECKEAGAKCIVTNSHETFCGRMCSPQVPCPSGYQCLAVKGTVPTSQCMPNDLSCYY
jgi:hypothetical protein